MNNFTYETENTRLSLETFEWDNTWIHNANDTNTARVLYIGDSISCGTRKLATEASGDKLLFDGFGTSKALDNPFFHDSIRLFAKQQRYRNAIIFNNGLHGFHLNDTEQYPHYYEQTVKFLLDEFKDTPIFLVLTTSVANAEREERVKLRNSAVIKIAEKYDLPVIDLYSTSAEFVQFRAADGVHFSKDGYTKFGEHIVGDVLKMIDLKY